MRQNTGIRIGFDSARESTDRNIGRVRRDGEDIYGFTAWKRQDEKENPRFA